MPQVVTLIKQFMNTLVELVVVFATIASIIHRDSTVKNVFRFSTRIPWKTFKVHTFARVSEEIFIYFTYIIVHFLKI